MSLMSARSCDSDAAVDAVDENAAIGTSVGITALASDADATNNTITYTLDDDAGGRFAIDGVTGEITVNGGLDYETDTSHNVTVRAASSDGSVSTQSFDDQRHRCVRIRCHADRRQ